MAGRRPGRSSLIRAQIIGHLPPDARLPLPRLPADEPAGGARHNLGNARQFRTTASVVQARPPVSRRAKALAICANSAPADEVRPVERVVVDRSTVTSEMPPQTVPNSADAAMVDMGHRAQQEPLHEAKAAHLGRQVRGNLLGMRREKNGSAFELAGREGRLGEVWGIERDRALTEDSWRFTRGQKFVHLAHVEFGGTRGLQGEPWQQAVGRPVGLRRI